MRACGHACIHTTMRQHELYLVSCLRNPQMRVNTQQNIRPPYTGRSLHPYLSGNRSHPPAEPENEGEEVLGRMIRPVQMHCFSASPESQVNVNLGMDPGDHYLFELETVLIPLKPIFLSDIKHPVVVVIRVGVDLQHQGRSVARYQKYRRAKPAKEMSKLIPRRGPCVFTVPAYESCILYLKQCNHAPYACNPVR